VFCKSLFVLFLLAIILSVVLLRLMITYLVSSNFSYRFIIYKFALCANIA